MASTSCGTPVSTMCVQCTDSTVLCYCICNSSAIILNIHIYYLINKLLLLHSCSGPLFIITMCRTVQPSVIEAKINENIYSGRCALFAVLKRESANRYTKVTNNLVRNRQILGKMEIWINVLFLLMLLIQLYF